MKSNKSVLWMENCSLLYCIWKGNLGEGKEGSVRQRSGATKETDSKLSLLKISIYSAEERWVLL